MHKRGWLQIKPGRVARKHQINDVFTRGSDLVYQLNIPKRKFWQRREYSLLSTAINDMMATAEQQHLAEYFVASLILQAPRSAMAQKNMDHYPHGFHEKHQRLDELIFFNDTYVSLILALRDDDREQANDRLKQLMDRFCKYLKAPCFSNEQWEAITHGLSREIAVYRTAKELGYEAHMTSRRQDAMGVDMVITDSRLEKSINLDIKTRSSFHFRLKDLVSEGRISEMQRESAEHNGFCMVVNGHDDEAVHTTLLRIDEEAFGRVLSFRLERPQVLAEKLADIMRY